MLTEVRQPKKSGKKALGGQVSPETTRVVEVPSASDPKVSGLAKLPRPPCQPAARHATAAARGPKPPAQTGFHWPSPINCSTRPSLGTLPFNRRTVISGGCGAGVVAEQSSTAWPEQKPDEVSSREQDWKLVTPGDANSQPPL